MTVLQALDAYYGRMAARGEAEAPGFSREKIGFAVVLDRAGAVVDVLDLRQMQGKKLLPVLREVPAAVKRTVGIQPNLLWDKTAYVLGRTAGAGRRTAEEHAAFKALHAKLLAGTADPGLVALRTFLEVWRPEQFDAPPFTAEMLDANLVFRLAEEARFLHDRPAAQTLLAQQSGGEGPRGICLVTGAEAPLRRLHPVIKGVKDAQSSGAALVSFNLDAFTSYGKEQGANAPTSELAAFRYGAALNRLLDRDSRQRLQIGDATVVFWADAGGIEGEAAASAAEGLFAALLTPPDDDRLGEDAGQAAKLRDALEKLAEGRPVAELELGLEPGTRFHVLGLAPNAARLSVRFWLADRFEAFAERLGAHARDLRIEPKPWRAAPPGIQRLLVKTTALQEKFENIPPLLAGEMTRAVLGGTRYPRTLLAATLIRLRAGEDPGSGWHALAIRACLARDQRLRWEQPDRSRPDCPRLEKEDPPVALDRDNPNPAYQLGRLFAALETAQYFALGRVNATIRDRYFGAASATPASVFPLLLRGAQNHLGKLRKEGKGIWIEREIQDIVDRLESDFPRSLKLEAQGRFAIGYYHQRRAQFAGRAETDNDDIEEPADA
jgi:CRISPR-associated protein Csd1